MGRYIPVVVVPRVPQIQHWARLSGSCVFSVGGTSHAVLARPVSIEVGRRPNTHHVLSPCHLLVHYSKASVIDSHICRPCTYCRMCFAVASYSRSESLPNDFCPFADPMASFSLCLPCSRLPVESLIVISVNFVVLISLDVSCLLAREAQRERLLPW